MESVKWGLNGTLSVVCSESELGSGERGGPLLFYALGLMAVDILTVMTVVMRKMADDTVSHPQSDTLKCFRGQKYGDTSSSSRTTCQRTWINMCRRRNHSIS